MHRPRERLAALAVLPLILLSACTAIREEPTPTPTPEATVECTDLFSGDPYTCTQTEYDELAVEEAKYDEASRLYDKVSYDIEALLADKKPMSDELRSHMVEDFLEETEGTFQEFNASSRFFSGHRVTEWSRPVSRSNKGSDLAIETCSSPGDFVTGVGEEIADPVYIREYVFFKEEGNGLVVSSTLNAVVDSC